MAFTKNIYLPNHLIEKVEEIENFSGLITELLVKYFDEKRFKNDIDDELQKFQVKAEKIANGLKEEEARLLVKKQEIEKEHEVEIISEEKQKEKRQRLINSIINSAKELFNADILEEEAREYLDGNYDNILQYLEKKGIVKPGEF
jgi:hypothetical protein